MTIRLEKLIPIPLLEQGTSGSDVWGKEDIVFEQGKQYLVEAPSGKGKTSLLSILYGLRKDYQGKVFLDGEEISSFGWKRWSVLRKNQFAYIFQGLELFDNLTARENIELKNSITGHFSSSQIEQMASELGIRQFLNRKAGILSFGQQQRVAILRAVCQPFNFLLADECFSHIDSQNRQLAHRLLQRECSSQGATMVLTSLNHTENLQTDIRLRL
jgi:ABC-type lipoprotein export system ATPase subunit